MREVAKSAGFTYTIVSVPKDSFRPELDYTEFLERATSKFDISLDW